MYREIYRQKTSKLTKNSVILISQIGVIDKERLKEKVPRINRETVEKGPP
jgi:mRNA-degrading endonuclease toxin of MazEF toxin-antitoxin module